MNEPEKNEQDIFIQPQAKEQQLPDTDAVKFAPSPSPTSLLIRLGLAKSSLREPLEALKSESWQTRVLALQLLTDLERDAPVSSIRACLQDPHEAVRMATVRALGKLWRFGVVPLELFLLALGDKHAEVRATTVRVLESLGPEALIDPLIKHLKEKLHRQTSDEGGGAREQVNHQAAIPGEEPIVCIAIIHLLGTLGKNAPVEELVNMLSDPEWQVREAAVSALEKLGDRTSEGPLLNALYDNQRFVRDAAISALKGRLPVETLVDNLFTLDPFSRKKTAELLGELGERIQQQSMIHALVRAAQTDPDSSVRKAALLALGQIGMPVPHTALRPLLHDPDQDVCEVAMHVLNALHPDYFDDQGNINPDYFDDMDLEEEKMDYPTWDERITEQDLTSKSSLKTSSRAKEADYTDKRIGNYRLLQQLARGGQSTVYLGEHIHLYTRVAVKVLHTHLSAQGVQHFLDEARTIARLKHPNIVRVLDCSVEDGVPYIVMDYMPRGTLRNLFAPGAQIQIWIIVVYIQQLARALDYAHRHGVIHLDIKPENILLGENNTVLLSDFGIARRIGDHTHRAKEIVAGTLSYAAPEQLAGKPVEASDQYALAIIVWELLIGSTSPGEKNSHTRGEYPNDAVRLMRKKNSSIPRKIQNVILQALAAQPENRYPNVQAFADALEKASLTVTRRTIFGFFHRSPEK